MQAPNPCGAEHVTHDPAARLLRAQLTYKPDRHWLHHHSTQVNDLLRPPMVQNHEALLSPFSYKLPSSDSLGDTWKQSEHSSTRQLRPTSPLHAVPAFAHQMGKLQGRKASFPQALPFIQGLGPRGGRPAVTAHLGRSPAEGPLSVGLLVRHIRDLCQKRHKETSTASGPVGQTVPGRRTIRDHFPFLKFKCFPNGLCCRRPRLQCLTSVALFSNWYLGVLHS